MSAPQIARFERVGLIAREHGKWPMAKTVKRLRRIHRVATENKRLLPLPRRVIYLRATNEDLLFDISDAKVAEAMVAMPELTFSYQKLQSVYAAYKHLSDRGWPPEQGGVGKQRTRPSLPRQSVWRDLLKEESDRGALQNRVTGFFYWDRLFPIYGSDLSAIPAEERIYLIAIVDTFVARRQASNFESQRTK